MSWRIRLHSILPIPTVQRMTSARNSTQGLPSPYLQAQYILVWTDSHQAVLIVDTTGKESRQSISSGMRSISFSQIHQPAHFPLDKIGHTEQPTAYNQEALTGIFPTQQHQFHNPCF